MKTANECLKISDYYNKKNQPKFEKSRKKILREHIYLIERKINEFASEGRYECISSDLSNTFNHQLYGHFKSELPPYMVSQLKNHFSQLGFTVTLLNTDCNYINISWRNVNV